MCNYQFKLNATPGIIELPYKILDSNTLVTDLDYSLDFEGPDFDRFEPEGHYVVSPFQVFYNILNPLDRGNSDNSDIIKLALQIVEEGQVVSVNILPNGRLVNGHRRVAAIRLITTFCGGENFLVKADVIPAGMSDKRGYALANHEIKKLDGYGVLYNWLKGDDAVFAKPTLAVKCNTYATRLGGKEKMEFLLNIGLTMKVCDVVSGLQKYLDLYEGSFSFFNLCHWALRFGKLGTYGAKTYGQVNKIRRARTLKIQPCLIMQRVVRNEPLTEEDLSIENATEVICPLTKSRCPVFGTKNKNNHSPNKCNGCTITVNITHND
jgi:hypothetical protein